MGLDRILIAKLLLSFVTLGYGLLTVRADFNRTHATNPLWTGHARFHVVWQITSYVGLGLIALGLIWVPGPLVLERLYLAAGIATVVYGAFFVTLMTMPLYDGRTHDDNAYRPFTLAGKRLDANVTAFSVMSAVLVLAVVWTVSG